MEFTYRTMVYRSHLKVGEERHPRKQKSQRTASGGHEPCALRNKTAVVF